MLNLALFSLLVAVLISPQWSVVASPFLDGRIIGGSVVDISRHPHQVSIRAKYARFKDPTFSHICGGSILSERIILSAAHCVYDRIPGHLMIIAGTNNREGGDGIIVPIEKFITHNKFNSTTFDCDVAILFLAANLPINNFTIKPIQLIDERPPAGAVARISGWGYTEDDSLSDLLREVNVPIISSSECNQDYEKIYWHITNNMICAGYRGIGGKDACMGDSGGPFIVNGKLAGVTSWGYDCARKDFPGVYASVADLKRWIADNIAQYGYK